LTRKLTFAIAVFNFGAESWNFRGGKTARFSSAIFISSEHLKKSGKKNKKNTEKQKNIHLSLVAKKM
jgi:hypothetical protein